MSLARTLRTLAPLRWSQIFSRARLALFGRRRPSFWSQDGAPTPVTEVRFPPEWNFSSPSIPARLLEDWRLGPIETDRLGAITLHYHDWALPMAKSEPAALRKALAHWIESCKPNDEPARHLAWNPYAIATRIPNWIRLWTLGAIADDFRKPFLESLWNQAAFLAANLEWDLRANHLLRDAVGLAWAGRFFGNARWLAIAKHLAVSQAAEQVLPDGMHAERSPMYHLHAMRDLFELLALVGGDNIEETLLRMRGALISLRHPDGGIALLNDAALTGSPTPHDVATAINGQPPPSPKTAWLRDAGLVCLHGSPWSVFFDVGEIGMDCQPGHAHADSLTIEASYDGRRLFVDPGTYGYDLDDRRRYDRSTAAHNTVCIDGEDSSEVWHIFRVGRRARPWDVNVWIQEHRASATHDGYDHLPGRPSHGRVIHVPYGVFTVRDHLRGQGTHRFEGGYLLAPDWTPVPAQGGWTLKGHTNLSVKVSGPPSLKLSIEPRPYHPEFGKEITTQRLQWRYDGPASVDITTIVEPA